MEPKSEAEQIEQAIQALEAQRAVLGEAVLEAALAPLREKLASLRDPSLGEQRKLVTVLFADLAGFTALAAGLDPEDVREIINTYFLHWSACIKRHAGLVEKYIGDAVLAVFGLPTARENDPERAIRAALDMQKELQGLNEQLESERGLRLTMRVGISTGEVVVSLLGERQGEEFVVVGDTVNLTSRLQSAAPLDGILITHATYRHVRGLFEASPFGPLDLKGIQQPVQAYWIKAAKPRSFRLHSRGVEGVETPLVGRQAELKRLQDALMETMETRERRQLTLVGEAGIGKSRLLHEFENWAELLPERIFYFRGRAHPGSQNVPYSLIRDVFAFRSQIQDSDPPPVVREKLEQNVSRVLGEENAGVMKAHFIARLLGFEIGESEHLRGTEQDAQGLHDRALVYLGDYLRAVGAAGPAVILLEDLHWADDSSLDLIHPVDRALTGRPILMVGTTRPSLFERRPQWGEGLPFHTRLPLSPLPARESQALVGAILTRVNPLPAALRDLVVNAAEGNPFYIEELIKMLIEDGVIVKAEAYWQVDEQRLGELRVPPTLTGVLQARFDSLSPDQRTYLQRGAVIGRVFWDLAVESLGAPDSIQPGSPPASNDHIFDVLQRREMVFRRDKSTFEDTVEFLFKHALLRDVTYASLLKRQRRMYHARAARWLESVTARTQRTGEFTMLIAEHCEFAGEAEQAADWYLRAGQAAAARFANQEALRALSRALELRSKPEPEWKFSVLQEREKVYELLGRREEQMADLAALQATAGESGQPALKARAALSRARYAHQTGDFPTAIEHARQAAELAEGLQDPELAANSSILLGSIVMRQGEMDLSKQHVQHALALLEGQNLHGIEAEGNRQLGLIAYYEGEPLQARDHFARALELFERTGDLKGVGSAINNLGGATFNLGEYEEAGRYYSRSLEHCREIGDRVGQGRALNNLGIVSVATGQYAQAEAFYLQGLEICREVGYRSFEMSALDNLGNLALYRYNYSLARKYQLEAMQGSQEMGDRVNESFAQTNLGRTALYMGDYERAESHLKDSLKLYQEFNDRQGGSQALINLSELHLIQGDLTTAQAYCDEALAAAKENRLRSEEGWAEHISAAILYRQGRYTEAAERFRQASEIRQEVGDSKEAIESVAALGQAVLAAHPQGDLKEAVAAAERVLAYLEEHGTEGFSHPMEVFLGCYQVLQAAGDERAPSVLQRGYALLQEIAAKIEEPALRQSYLERVPENRALAAAWQAAGQAV